LVYDRLDGTLAVFVHDALTGEEFVVPVNGDEAAEGASIRTDPRIVTRIRG